MMPEPTTGLVVRAARAADAEQLAPLFEALNRHQGDPVEHMDLSRVRTDALGDDSWFETLVAERAGTLVGYLCFHMSYETGYGAKGFYVQDLYVVDEARQEGVGRSLVAAAARIARTRGAIFLWWTSKAWNEEAHAVYARWGAIEEPVRAHALFGPAFDRLANEA